MTATELQRIVSTLANNAWTRYWLDWSADDGQQWMMVQCIDIRGYPVPINDAERLGFTEGLGCCYTIARTNEDGSPYRRQL